MLARNERIQNLEALLQDADRRLAVQNQKFEAQLQAVKDRLDQARGKWLRDRAPTRGPLTGLNGCSSSKGRGLIAPQFRPDRKAASRWRGQYFRGAIYRAYADSGWLGEPVDASSERGIWVSFATVQFAGMEVLIGILFVFARGGMWRGLLFPDVSDSSEPYQRSVRLGSSTLGKDRWVCCSGILVLFGSTLHTLSAIPSRRTALSCHSIYTTYFPIHSRPDLHSPGDLPGCRIAAIREFPGCGHDGGMELKDWWASETLDFSLN